MLLTKMLTAKIADVGIAVTMSSDKGVELSQARPARLARRLRQPLCRYAWMTKKVPVLTRVWIFATKPSGLRTSLCPYVKFST